MMMGWIAAACCAASVAAEPPAFQNLRYEESAAAYREVDAASPLEEGKYVTLGDSDDMYVSFGGQARVRWEMWDNAGFDAANDDDFGLLRLRLHADLVLGEHVRVFVEGKSATATDRDLPGGRRTLDVDELDLQNGFVDLMDDIGAGKGVVRIGRQELSFGAQRLVSPLDWSNTRRTWDGARAIYSDASWRVDLFATQFVPVEKYDFNEPDADQKFNGIYAVHKLPDWGMTYDLYLLQLDRDNITDGELYADDRFTAGMRLAGACKLTGIEYDIEGGWQFGDADAWVAVPLPIEPGPAIYPPPPPVDSDRDIAAWFVAVELGYTWKDVTMKPRVYAGYDIASGDDDPLDGDAGTFNPLFPLGHAYFGYIDMIGRQNIEDFSQGISFWPVADKVQLKLDYHTFRRVEREDGVYNAGGALVATDPWASSDVGSEFDLTLTVKVSRSTLLHAGASRFFTGDFFKTYGPAEDIDFAYASVQYTF